MIAQLEARFAARLGDHQMIRIVVHGNGHQENLSLNVEASAFYGHPITGDAVVVEID